MRSLSMGARAFIPVALAGAAPHLARPRDPGRRGHARGRRPSRSSGSRCSISATHWHYGAAGPRAFDCSGLVIYAFRHAGDRKALPHVRSARALYNWYRAHHLASRSNPKPGDLVIWGGGTHVGIYIGHGKAISTLTRGVRVHGVHAVTARFTAYLHTGMWKRAAR